jgi:hypothetical protein
MKAFPISMDTMVVTSTYVTEDQLPILYVSHEDDEGESLWQFHCGNDDYSPKKIQLVRLDTILAFDSELIVLADLEKGYSARRKSPTDAWTFVRES